MLAVFAVVVEDHHHDALHVLASVGVAFGALFPIVNPLSKVAIFVGLTSRMSQPERLREARHAAIAVFAVLALFLVFGRLLLDLFEISLSGLQIAGAILVGWVGFQMSTGKLEDPEARPSERVFLAPLAIPLLAGPGAMGVVLGLGSRSDSHWDYIGFVAGIVLLCLFLYALFSRAERLVRLIGPTGMDALNRVFGLLVLAIAAEMMFHGIAEHED